MRLRVYRDERNFALSRDYDDGEPLWEGPDGEHLSDERVHRPGWRELVVLDPDADAQRLAEAIRAAVELDDARHIEEQAAARAVLDRLAAGTESIRDAATHSMGADDLYGEQREWRRAAGTENE